MKLNPPKSSAGNHKNLTGRQIPNIVKIILVLAAVILGYGLVFVATARAQDLTVACYKDYRPYSYVNDKGDASGLPITSGR